MKKILFIVAMCFMIVSCNSEKYENYGLFGGGSFGGGGSSSQW
jgi:hypothetical protein